MSERDTPGYYVYQPYGSVTDPARAKVGRLYGVGGLPIEARCDGLTKSEATAIVEALTPTPAPTCQWTEPSLRHALEELEQDLRKVATQRRGYSLDTGMVEQLIEWADRLSALLAAHPDAPEPLRCVHGHTTKTVGCVSCELLFRGAR